jgi:hypothetical protein
MFDIETSRPSGAYYSGIMRKGTQGKLCLVGDI